VPATDEEATATDEGGLVALVVAAVDVAAVDVAAVDVAAVDVACERDASMGGGSAA
jgi:hypothetical protein